MSCPSRKSTAPRCRIARTPSFVALSITTLALSLLGSACSADLENPELYRAPIAAGGSSGGAGTGGKGGASGSAGMAGASPMGGCDAPGTVFKLEPMSGGCSGAACHAGGGMFAPNLTEAMAAMSVLGPDGNGAPATLNACGTYVDPDDIDNSAIMKKITGTTCGARMPTGGMMTQAQIDCVKSWLESIVSD